MDDSASGDTPRTIPVDPTVRVESFASHCTLTWKARGLSQFVDAVGTLEQAPPSVPVVVDDTAVAGRSRSPLSDLDDSDTIRYLRVEPTAPWTASWERRTWPVVSVSGTPTASVCRQLHLETTSGDDWTEAAFETVCEVVNGVSDASH